MRRSLSLSILCASLATLHCSRQRVADGDESSIRHPLVATAAAAEQPSLTPKDATDATMKANAAYLSMLPFSDRQDFDDAQRGFVAKPPSSVVKDKSGRVVWSLEDYAFEQAAEAPPTVNPSLWRQARLNRISGLFKVADRVYQVRGFDISNYREDAELPNPDATITLSKTTWDAIAEKKTTLPGEIDAGRVQIAGNRTKVTDLFAMLDDFDPRFDIVTP